MSDLMLHGVLNMPPELWSGDPLDVLQRHDRYVAASNRIASLKAQRDELLATLKHHQEQTRPIQQSIDIIAKYESSSPDL